MAVPVVSIFQTGDYDAQIRRGIKVVASGGIVVLPTETIYGAAGLLDRADARGRLSALRANSSGPFTIHLARAEDAHGYLEDLNEFGRRMIRKLWPGPVGLSFAVAAEQRKQVSAKLQVAESDLYDDYGITLRCPEHIVAWRSPRWRRRRQARLGRRRSRPERWMEGPI
jgi:tRNA A37 threonylcarbamoyladenosine synthetase subunit TsaC/SUA5/YrdC